MGALKKVVEKAVGHTHQYSVTAQKCRETAEENFPTMQAEK